MSSSLSPIRVGVAGLGRSGWNIHCAAFGKLPDHYKVVAVTDPDQARMQEANAKFGCAMHSSFDALINDPNVELVVVATPSKFHASNTISALKAGKAVVCEKPFATSANEADQVLKVADETGKLVAPFQNRRFAPDFRKVQEILASGKLGRITQIRCCVHSFGRRWDWQTLREFGGGELNNTGPHFLDQLLELLGEGEPEIFCHLDRALTSGDADDCAKVILRIPGRPLVELEISKANAYPQKNWTIMGTSGSLTGSITELSWKYVDFSKMPERPVDRTPQSADRQYNRETLEFTEETWKASPEESDLADNYYRSIYGTIREGKPLVVTPQSVRRQIHILQRCHDLGGM